MPPTTTIQTFINALRTKQTKITKELDKLLRDRARNLTAEELAAISAAGAFAGPTSGWPLSEDITANLTPAEIAHIEAWPEAQREAVRQAIVTAINGEREMRFFWELYAGPAPATDVQDLPDLPYIVMFRTPGTQVQVQDEAQGEINVMSG